MNENFFKERQFYTSPSGILCRHDGGISPNEVIEEISPEHLDELKQSFIRRRWLFPQGKSQRSRKTRDQADSPE